MIKQRVRQAKITNFDILRDIKRNFGDLSQVDPSEVYFEYEIYGLTLTEIQNIGGRWEYLVGDVIDDSYLLGIPEYEFMGYDHYAKTNAIKIRFNDLTLFLDNVYMGI